MSPRRRKRRGPPVGYRRRTRIALRRLLMMLGVDVTDCSTMVDYVTKAEEWIEANRTPEQIAEAQERGPTDDEYRGLYQEGETPPEGAE